MTNTKTPATKSTPRAYAEDTHDHAAHAGAHCADDGRGCCRDCGVMLVDCEVCGGIGYHTELCTEG